MAPEESVLRLAEIISSGKGFDPDNIQDELIRVGVPSSLAAQTFHFTQIAWGRFYLNGLGIRFPSDYTCFNGNGDVVDSGILAAQPHFVAAMKIAPRFAQTPGFQFLAFTSAAVQSVNSALNNGSRPENLVMGPPCIFLQEPTPQGVEKARRYLSQRIHAAAERAGNSPSVHGQKPWWKFW